MNRLAYIANVYALYANVQKHYLSSLLIGYYEGFRKILCYRLSRGALSAQRCCSPKRQDLWTLPYLEVGFFADDQVKMSSLGWAVIQYG